MPYGVPNEKPEQTKWMEKCVSSVMSKNPKYDESKAIAICKAQLKKNSWKVKKGDSELEVEFEEAEREVVTKVPNVKRTSRVMTWGPKTI